MRLLSLALMAWALAPVAHGVESNADFDLNKTFLTKYCVSCHGDEKAKGGYNFEAFGDSDWNDQGLLDELTRRADVVASALEQSSELLNSLDRAAPSADAVPRSRTRPMPSSAEPTALRLPHATSSRWPKTRQR